MPESYVKRNRFTFQLIKESFSALHVWQSNEKWKVDHSFFIRKPSKRLMLETGKTIVRTCLTAENSFLCFWYALIQSICSRNFLRTVRAQHDGKRFVSIFNIPVKIHQFIINCQIIRISIWTAYTRKRLKSVFSIGRHRSSFSERWTSSTHQSYQTFKTLNETH